MPGVYRGCYPRHRDAKLATGGGRKSTGAAMLDTGDAKLATWGERKSTGAAKIDTGGAKVATGGDRKSTGAAIKTQGLQS